MNIFNKQYLTLRIKLYAIDAHKLSHEFSITNAA